MPQIYGYALSGVGRSGAERSGYTSPRVFVAINGVQYASARLTDANKVVDGSLSITEVLNETPNTAALTMMGAEPPEGSDVVITLGSINNLDRLYAGTVLNRTHAYVDTPASWHSAMNVIDYTWQLTRRKVSGLFTNVSPAFVAAAIVAAVPGFTLKVAAGLPTLDTFSFTDVDALAALTQLAQRIGGYCDVDYHKVVKLFLTDASVTNPTDLTSAHVSLSEFSFTRDLSQVRTRVFVEGGGVNALAACAPGDTVIPVETTAWYDIAGGKVKSGPQHIAYGGVDVGGGGSLVGPGVTPSAGPGNNPAVGTGLTPDSLYRWAYTWVTAAGETQPSPLDVQINWPLGIGGAYVNLSTFTLNTPSSAPNTFVDLTGFNTDATIVPGDTYGFTVTYVRGGGETLIGPTGSHVAVAGTGFSKDINFNIDGTAQGNGLIQSINLYMNHNGGAFHLQRNLPGPGTYGVTTYNASGAAPPGASTAVYGQGFLTGIAIGPAGVTSRKVYRTVAGGAQLKLQSTIANNTVTSANDAVADGSLGANAPTSDTSGLAPPTGQVNPGSVTLLTAGTGGFSSTGGFVAVGSQVVRYTGIAGNSLTGIPAAGVGAILTAIQYGTALTAVAVLTGIPSSGPGAIQYPILSGDPVNLLVQVDDLAAQAALAALLGGTDDGVVEDYIQDGSIGETEALARGRARLAQASLVLVSVTFKTRDRNTHAGRTIHVNLGSPTSVTADFQIQQVTIDQFGPALLPTYTVQASSARFSLEDLLRVFRQQAA